MSRAEENNRKLSNTQMKKQENKQNPDEKTEENQYPDAKIEVKAIPIWEKLRNSEGKTECGKVKSEKSKPGWENPKISKTQMRKSKNKQNPDEKIQK